MPRKRKLSNFQDRCRFCLARDNCMSDLFVDWIRPKLQDLEKCSSIEIMDKPNYPKNICYVCLYKLEMWAEFKLQFQKTNKALITHFKVVDQTVNEAEKQVKVDNVADDLFSDDNKKRLKIEECRVTIVKSTNVDLYQSKMELIPKNNKVSPSKTIEVNLNAMTIDEETNNSISATKTQPSDTSVISNQKRGRSKKDDRKASTKRWVDRKNALIAATGEASTETDSDNSSQLSPVQKARARSNNEKDIERKRKIDRALKNLEMNVTEKYKYNQNEIDLERKRRSRRFYTKQEEKLVQSEKKLQNQITEHNETENHHCVERERSSRIKEINKQSPAIVKEIMNQSETVQNSKQSTVLIKNLSFDYKETEKQFRLGTELEKQQSTDANTTDVQNKKNSKIDNGIGESQDNLINETEKQSINIVEVDKETSNTNIENNESIISKEIKKQHPNITEEKKDSETTNLPETVFEETEIEFVEEVRNNSEIIIEESDKQLKDMNRKKSLPKAKINSTSSMKTPSVHHKTNLDNDIEILEISDNNEKHNICNIFKPQLVSSEVTIGENTYIITTTLDIEDPKILNSDISFVTNGTKIDATQGGKKINIKNPLHFQQILLSQNSQSMYEKTSSDESDIQKCLKIYIEGMGVEDLQRVQLELAHFVSEDIEKCVLQNASLFNNVDTKPSKMKDAFEDLNNQLKTLIEKVLRNNYEKEMTIKPSMISNYNKISSEFIKAAKHSSIFQPKVKIPRMNLVTLCKKFRINNLHILETVKRQRGIVGPLSRILGKRRKILPKKFDGFTLTLTDTIQQDIPKLPLKTLTTESSTVTVMTLSNPNTPNVNQSVIPNTEHEIIIRSSQLSTNTPPVTVTEFRIEELGDCVEYTTDKKMQLLVTPVETVTKTISSAIENIAVIATTPTITNKSTNIIMKSTTTSNSTIKSLPLIANATTNLNSKVTSCPTPLKKIAPKPSKIITNTPSRQRHICGICGKELFSKIEAEAHVKQHTIDSKPPSPQKTATTPSITISNTQKSKPKLMRCKKCQAIVEDRQVKSHVCNSVKYNCNLCDCSFGTEHLLIAHLDSHSHFQTKETIPKNSPTKDQYIHKTQKSNDVKNVKPTLGPEEDLEDILMDKEPQGYSCFVCDKVFVDEEQMKDHLQMHCEEVSDDGNDKGFQCAFCGEKFQTEESLETHVGNHLMEDGDEKINMLINLGTKRDRQKRTMFKCDQCSESFPSSLLLAMHLPLHEEEEEMEDNVMVVDQEKQDEELEHHVCTICDEIFDTPEELSEHLDVHNGNVHVCILCEKPFSSIRDLQEHVSTHL